MPTRWQGCTSSQVFGLARQDRLVVRAVVPRVDDVPAESRKVATVGSPSGKGLVTMEQPGLGGSEVGAGPQAPEVATGVVEAGPVYLGR